MPAFSLVVFESTKNEIKATFYKIYIASTQLETMDSSDSDADEFQIDNDSADLDYQPNSDSDYTNNATSTASETDQTLGDTNIEFEIDSGVIDDTVRHDLSLKTVLKPKSNSKIWNYFGFLLYKLVLVSKVSHRVYCKICFDAGSLKRYTKTREFKVKYKTY